MSRPQKPGFDYFPLDVDFAQDPKIRALAQKHGPLAELIFIKLLCRVYSRGYYFELTLMEKLCLLKDVNVTETLFDEVLMSAIAFGLFDEGVWKRDRVLTSAAIQARFMVMAVKRKDNEIKANLSLCGKNPPSAGVNSKLSTQSKVKESKGKEIEEEENNNQEIIIVPDGTPKKPKRTKPKKPDADKRHRYGPADNLRFYASDAEMAKYLALWGKPKTQWWINWFCTQFKGTEWEASAKIKDHFAYIEKRKVDDEKRFGFCDFHPDGFGYYYRNEITRIEQNGSIQEFEIRKKRNQAKMDLLFKLELNGNGHKECSGIEASSLPDPAANNGAVAEAG